LGGTVAQRSWPFLDPWFDLGLALSRGGTHGVRWESIYDSADRGMLFVGMVALFDFAGSPNNGCLARYQEVLIGTRNNSGFCGNCLACTIMQHYSPLPRAIHAALCKTSCSPDYLCVCYNQYYSLSNIVSTYLNICLNV
jgi:hypothetical protein